MADTGASSTVTWREIGALFLLPFGGFAVPVVGWFLGVLLLWFSDSWTTRDKLIGTFVVPFGLLGSVLLAWAFAQSASGGTLVLWIVLLAVLFLAPLAADGYLVWRLRRGIHAY
jgi:hypothetical protein